MVRDKKRRRVDRNPIWAFGPRAIRMFILCRTRSLQVSRKKGLLLHPHEDKLAVNPVNVEESDATSLSIKRITFVPPKLDETELIIEEIDMGVANAPRAEFGSKVRVRFKFETDNGQDSKAEFDIVLGDGEVMGELHKGIIGMRPWDTRKITIPLSICNRDETIPGSICEVTLLKIHKDR